MYQNTAIDTSLQTKLPVFFSFSIFSIGGAKFRFFNFGVDFDKKNISGQNHLKLRLIIV